MSGIQDILCFGFVPLGEHKQGFLLPIFGSIENPLVQDADNYDRIQNFTPCDLPSKTVVVSNSEEDRRSVGDQMLYAFQLMSGGILRGTKAEVQSELKSYFAGFKPYPNLYSEVAAFLQEVPGSASRITKDVILSLIEAEREKIDEEIANIRKQLDSSAVQERTVSRPRIPKSGKKRQTKAHSERKRLHGTAEGASGMQKNETDKEE
jgi:hypothetical protein